MTIIYFYVHLCSIKFEVISLLCVMSYMGVGEAYTYGCQTRRSPMPNELPMRDDCVHDGDWADGGGLTAAWLGRDENNLQQV